MAGAVWIGVRRFSGPLTDAEEAELIAACVYCGYCGSKMREVLWPSPEFDRQTGRQGKRGTLHWQCPKHGVGLEAMHGDWMDHHDDNPHDSVMLRQV